MSQSYTLEELVPLPAVCTGLRKHQFLGRDMIMAPTLRNCVCFYCGKPLKPHPLYRGVIDAETRRKQRLQQSALPLENVS